MKKQLIWVFEWRKSVQYWWSYISFSPECKELNQHARPSIIQTACPTCCYQVCALDHANVGTADLDYSSGPCHRNGSFHTLLDMWLFIHAGIKVKPCLGLSHGYELVIGNSFMKFYKHQYINKLDSTRRKASEICLRPPLDIYSNTFSR